MKLNELTLVAAAEGLRKKKFSSQELVSACLDAIKEKNATLHVFLTVMEEQAQNEALRADTLIAHGDAHSPLTGIPLAIKDNILIKNISTTAGSHMLEHYNAPYDAGVITKLREYGAIMIGKTNLDEFAMGSSTEHSAYGPTLNPRAPSRVPGGSSGGSAAAIAAHLSIASLGSDTGGSIRQPAALCGIVGMKPSYGAVSRSGLIAMASSLDQIGPLAKSVDDAALLFEAIAGRDPLDATSLALTDRTNENLSIKGLRIGVPKEYFSEGIDPDVAQSIHVAINKAEAAGATIIEISLPHSRYALPAYYLIVSSEISSNLARYDGIRYGFRANNYESLIDMYEYTRAEGFGEETKRRIMLGTYTLSAGYYDAYYLKAQRVRRLIQNDFATAFSRVDVIAGPTTPSPAFKIGERARDPLSMYLADIYTVAVNLAGLPAISLPAGTVNREGILLPIGLQLIAARNQDHHLFDYARLFERIL